MTFGLFGLTSRIGFENVQLDKQRYQRLPLTGKAGRSLKRHYPKPSRANSADPTALLRRITPASVLKSVGIGPAPFHLRARD